MEITYHKHAAMTFSDQNESRVIAKKCNKDNFIPIRSEPWQVMNWKCSYVVACLSKNPNDGTEALTYIKNRC
jgi:hypothetical protein